MNETHPMAPPETTAACRHGAPEGIRCGCATSTSPRERGAHDDLVRDATRPRCCRGPVSELAPTPEATP